MIRRNLVRRRGIIPACAGSTISLQWNSFQNRDHPRMCGEHPYSKIVFIPMMGSSPHVRGAP